MPETFLWHSDISYSVDGNFVGCETEVSQGEGGTKRYRSKRATDEMEFKINLPRMALPDAWQLYQFYKRQLGGATGWYLWVPDCELVENGSFETGDFTDFTNGGGNSAIDGTVVHSGAYSSMLVASGSGNLYGAYSNAVRVDPARIYKATSYQNVTDWVAGSYRMRVRYLDSGESLISAQDLNAWSAATSGWELMDITMGPSGGGADYDFPATTAYVNLQGYWQGGTAEGTAYMDDVSLIGYRRFLVHFKGNNLSWSYFRNWRHKLTLDVEGSPA
jgi:hypothetical protein